MDKMFIEEIERFTHSGYYDAVYIDGGDYREYKRLSDGTWEYSAGHGHWADVFFEEKIEALEKLYQDYIKVNPLPENKELISLPMLKDDDITAETIGINEINEIKELTKDQLRELDRIELSSKLTKMYNDFVAEYPEHKPTPKTCQYCKHFNFKSSGSAGRNWGECSNEEINIFTLRDEVYISLKRVDPQNSNATRRTRFRVSESEFGCIYFEGKEL